MINLNPELKLNPDIFENPTLLNIRDGFGEGLVQAANENERVVVLCADLTESTRVEKFAKQFPNRFIETGISEQNLMGMAAGLALSGKIPFASSYAVFNPGRNYDQLRVSVCYSMANVKIVGSHAGLSVGPDGASHQALEDLAITRVLPNIMVVVPTDYNEAIKMTVAISKTQSPTYIRFPRSSSASITTIDTPFQLGKGYVYKQGKDVTIAAIGIMVAESLKAANILQEQGIDAEVLVFPTIKPFDSNLLLESVRKTGKIVTAEEHQINGGFGGLIAEILTQNYPIRQRMIGMKDSFGESGTPEELYKKYHMTDQDIVNAALELINLKTT